LSPAETRARIITQSCEKVISLRYRKLGAGDLEVSEISLGSWLTYGVGVARENAVACVDRAFELGINFIDTANVYGRGAAETFLGEVLASRPRDSYILATKVYFSKSATDSGLSRAQIAKQIDASLKRLRVDHVDLYQCHRYDSSTPIEETPATRRWASPSSPGSPLPS
jgi:aryl-alcohol dehydrogenase-like predicted oxidoreductase